MVLNTPSFSYTFWVTAGTFAIGRAAGGGNKGVFSAAQFERSFIITGPGTALSFRHARPPVTP